MAASEARNAHMAAIAAIANGASAGGIAHAGALAREAEQRAAWAAESVEAGNETKGNLEAAGEA